MTNPMTGACVNAQTLRDMNIWLDRLRWEVATDAPPTPRELPNMAEISRFGPPATILAANYPAPRWAPEDRLEVCLTFLRDECGASPELLARWRSHVAASAADDQAARAGGARRRAAEAAATTNPQWRHWRTRLAEILADAAEAHGNNEGDNAGVRDLQTVLNAAFRRMSPGEGRILLQDDGDVRALLNEVPEYEDLKGDLFDDEGDLVAW